MSQNKFLQEATVPSPYSRQHTVEMLLRIRQDRPHYKADVLVEGDEARGSIPLTEHDVRDINSKLQRAVGELAEAFAGDGTESLKSKMYQLAYYGRFAFERVFSDRYLREFVLTVLAQPRLSVIEIASDDFFVPWELLYDDEAQMPDVSLEGFWGTKHLAYRVITRKRYGAPLFSEILFTKRPVLGLLVYDKLTNVADREIPYFEELAKQDKIDLDRLRPLKPVSWSIDPEVWMSEYREFQGFWRKKLDVVHLACHAFQESEEPDSLSIVLSEEYHISCENLGVYKIRMENHPFVMLNACSTGSLNPLFTSGLVLAFWEAGARGILATDCEIPDVLAANFARQLYSHLLAGKSIGDSLLSTRRYFLERRNPSGLLYSLFAYPSIRLVQKGD